MRDFIRRPSTVYFLFYFILLSLLKWDMSLGVLMMWLGGVIGLMFEWVDRIAYVYFTRPHEQLSFQVKSMVLQKRYKDALSLMNHRKHEQKHLTVRSLLFLIVWVLAAFFVLTSTGSLFAGGMIMAIGLSVLTDMLQDWNNLRAQKEWLFWQIKRDFTDRETRAVVIGFGVVFVLMSLIII